MIKKIPIPLAGPMLGTAALGSLLQVYSGFLHAVCGWAATFLLLLLFAKIIRYPKMIANDLQSPVFTGIGATFFMGIMMLSTYLEPFFHKTALVIWLAAIIGHACLLIYFICRFVLAFDLELVYPSWFVISVGLATCGATAPSYGMERLGAVTFWFSLCMFLIMFFIVTRRYIALQVPEPAKPLIGIYTAPLALCIVAYVHSVQNKSAAFLLIMLSVSAALYIFALIKMTGYLRMPFYPSIAAYTFPFVISATAMQQSALWLEETGQGIMALNVFSYIQTGIAVAFVIYAYARYMLWLFRKEK
ncbi:MAG: TDT family transporter [Firmicutes bacterium]|nr:TDT family transporter [Bacillota bacterium]